MIGRRKRAERRSVARWKVANCENGVSSCEISGSFLFAESGFLGIGTAQEEGV